MSNGSLFAVNEEYYFRSTNSPERKLLVAIIERAILDLFSRDKHIRIQARMWIEGKVTVKRCNFSFAFCLRELDMEKDIKRLRRKMLSLDCFQLRERVC